MTAQKIANILYGNGYKVSKTENGYETSTFAVRYGNEIVFSCKGCKDLKDWFKIMNERYDFTNKYNGEVPQYTLDGFKQ